MGVAAGSTLIAETANRGGDAAFLADVWAEALGRRPATDEADFFEMGGDSLAAFEATLLLQERFGERIDAAFLYRLPRLGDQARALALGDAAAPPDPLLVPLAGGLEPGTDGYAWIISGLDGHVAPFSGVAAALHPRWRLIGLLDPVFVADEPRFDDIGSLADRFFDAIRRLDCDGPYLVIGYSQGGAVAHEIGRLALSAGRRAGVVILDHKARGHASLAARSVAAARRIKRVLSGRPPVPPAAGRRAPRRYEHSDAPTVLIRTRAARRRFQRRDYGWSRAARLVDVHLVEGDHLDFFKGDRRRGFCAALSAALARLRAELGR